MIKVVDERFGKKQTPKQFPFFTVDDLGNLILVVKDERNGEIYCQEIKTNQKLDTAGVAGVKEYFESFTNETPVEVEIKIIKNLGE